MHNSTLFGLKQASKINVIYDTESKTVSKANGIDIDAAKINISEEISFSIPTFIIVNGIPLFPSKYEFINKGKVVYGSKHPPLQTIYIDDKNPLTERLKTKENTITLLDLEENDINRKRTPSQNQIMGESAKQHAQKLINNGLLIVPSDLSCPVDWHWCHLISFRMLPTEKAQKKNNLFCGTSACNGHMANIEAAVKRFIYEYKRPLGLEVCVTTHQNTLVAKKVRYRVYDGKGSKRLHSEYFDALTNTKSDALDFFSIYERLENAFNNTN